MGRTTIAGTKRSRDEVDVTKDVQAYNPEDPYGRSWAAEEDLDFRRAEASYRKARIDIQNEVQDEVDRSQRYYPEVDDIDDPQIWNHSGDGLHFGDIPPRIHSPLGIFSDKSYTQPLFIEHVADPLPHRTYYALDDAPEGTPRYADKISRGAPRYYAPLYTGLIDHTKEQMPKYSLTDPDRAYSLVSEAPQGIRIKEGDDLLIEDNAELPYRLVKNLGHGHSASVEMVEDVHTKTVFARKVFRIFGTRCERRSIFENEIKIIRRLAPHHHIIRVFATYVSKREVGLILSPVADGGDLEGFLHDYKEEKAAGTVQPEKSKILESSFGCLASAISFMHRQKVRHKDIKPQNILIHQGSMIITDFGYSLDHSKIGKSTTTGRPSAFTRRYCAPEVNDWGPRNSRSDIFSLGCVFLEILLALNETIAASDSSIPYQEVLEDSHFRSSLMQLSALGLLTSLMLCDEPDSRPDAALVVSSLKYIATESFCTRCLTSRPRGTANGPIQYFFGGSTLSEVAASKHLMPDQEADLIETFKLALENKHDLDSAIVFAILLPSAWQLLVSLTRRPSDDPLQIFWGELKEKWLKLARVRPMPVCKTLLT